MLKSTGTVITVGKKEKKKEEKIENSYRDCRRLQGEIDPGVRVKNFK